MFEWLDDIADDISDWWGGYDEDGPYNQGWFDGYEEAGGYGDIDQD